MKPEKPDMRQLLAAILLILGLAGVACVPSGTQAFQPPPTPSPLPLPDTPTEYVPTPLPVTPTYEGCAYVWASKDMPELSRKLNASLQDISMDLNGLAYAYGEDCIYGDGHKTFSAMETDFRVGVKVSSVKDEDALGNWIDKVMQVILDIPQDQLQGPRAGRVDFDFKQPDPAEVFVTVPIDKYRQQARELKGAALFRFFYNNP